MRLIAVFFCVFLCCFCDTFPRTEYEYSLRRDDLLKAEKRFYGKDQRLTESEQMVDHFLQHLKWKEFRNTKTAFLPARPIEEVMDNITRSEIYAALRKLPKGGNMHMHENHWLSKRILLDLAYNSSDFDNFYIQRPTGSRPWRLDFFVNPPANDPWVKVKDSGYTKEFIYRKQVLMYLLDEKARRYPTDSAERWKQMQPLWGRASWQLIHNIKIYREHIKWCYKYAYEEGALYAETKKRLSNLYELDPDPRYNTTFGKKFLDPTGGEMEINITLEVMREFKRDHPNFIGHKRIVQSYRRLDNTAILQRHLDIALRFHRKYPDHVVGFDIVSEEDKGNSNLFFLKNMLTLYDDKTKKSKIPLILHAGETSWPSDLQTSIRAKDPLATAQNVYEAVLLGARRIGHGLALTKHPYLLRVMKEKGIAVDQCPISNQILGYTPDLRNHPGVSYYRAGVPIVLGGDDPGTFGTDPFTLDWYTVYMAWGLDLFDLKKIALNSLNYSAMSSAEKTTAYNVFTRAWDEYITSMRTRACATRFAQQPRFKRILPRDGARNAATLVHIFGADFESGICKAVKCRFGAREVPAMYHTNWHLTCQAPALSQTDDTPNQEAAVFNMAQAANQNVSVSVSFNAGQTWHNTGEFFAYKHTAHTTTTAPTRRVTDRPTDRPTDGPTNNPTRRPCPCGGNNIATNTSLLIAMVMATILKMQ